MSRKTSLARPRRMMWQREGDHYHQVVVTGDVGKDGRLRVSWGADLWGDEQWSRVKSTDLYESEIECIEAILERIDRRIARDAEIVGTVERAGEWTESAETLRNLGRALGQAFGLEETGKPMWRADYSGRYERVYVVGSARRDGRAPIVEYAGGPVTLVPTHRLFEKEEDALAQIKADAMQGGAALVRHRNKLIERLCELKGVDTPMRQALAVDR